MFTKIVESNGLTLAKTTVDKGQVCDTSGYLRCSNGNEHLLAITDDRYNWCRVALGALLVPHHIQRSGNKDLRKKLKSVFIQLEQAVSDIENNGMNGYESGGDEEDEQPDSP